MPDQVGTSQVIRFATFEVDLQAQELRKAGLRLKLSGQPFQVLAILLEQPGVVVTREELQKRLWPDTFVDVDHNLNTAINKIREVLGDSAENPGWVETLAEAWISIHRRGRSSGAAHDSDQARSRQAFSSKMVEVRNGYSGQLVCSFGVGVAYRWPWHGLQLEQVRSLAPLPFTALPGVETSRHFPRTVRESLSRGTAIPPREKGFDLYVKGIGSETMLRLTQHPSEWLSPVWSPDGTQIAFHRLAGADTGIYIVPAFGSPEREVAVTHVPYAVPSTMQFVARWRVDRCLRRSLACRALRSDILISLDTLETDRCLIIQSVVTNLAYLFSLWRQIGLCLSTQHEWTGADYHRTPGWLTENSCIGFGLYGWVHMDCGRQQIGSSHIYRPRP